MNFDKDNLKYNPKKYEKIAPRLVDQDAIDSEIEADLIYIGKLFFNEVGIVFDIDADYLKEIENLLTDEDYDPSQIPDDYHDYMKKEYRFLLAKEALYDNNYVDALSHIAFQYGKNEFKNIVQQKLDFLADCDEPIWQGVFIKWADAMNIIKPEDDQARKLAAAVTLRMKTYTKNQYEYYDSAHTFNILRSFRDGSLS
jgi:hypothetical protein